MMKKIVIGSLLLSVLLVPAMAFAQPNVTIGSLDQLVNAIRRPLWVVFGVIALVAFVIAGILFLTAAGDPEKIRTARTAFLWGVVGIVVGIIAYSILRIVETAFT